MISKIQKKKAIFLLSCIAVVISGTCFSGCSDESPVDVSQEEIDNLSVSMKEANDMFLKAAEYWDSGNFEKAKSSYENVSTMYRKIDSDAKQMYNRTQNEKLQKWLNLLSLTSQNMALASDELATASDLAIKERKKTNPDESIYMKHVEKAKEYANKAWEYFTESQKI